MTPRHLPALSALAVIFILLHLCRCSTTVTGVETTNGFTVTATATAVSGNAPPHSQVYLCDTGYIPFVNSGIGLQTSPDPSGAFSFSIRPGSYLVAVFGPSGYLSGVHLARAADAPVSSPTINRTLEEPGTITGNLSGTSDSLLVYLAGMSHYALLSSNRNFTLNYVPAGTYRLRVLRIPVSGQKPGVVLYDEPIVVPPGKTIHTGVLSITP